MANGTLNPETIKQNVMLYASLLETGRKMTTEPEKIKSELRAFFDRNLNEEQKADALLNLLFENEKDREIYKQRWESVKDAPIFKNNFKRGFANVFNREDIKKGFKNVAVRNIKNAFENIKDGFKRGIKEKDNFKLQLSDATIGIDEIGKYNNYLERYDEKTINEDKESVGVDSLYDK